MATFHAEIDKRRRRKDGSYPIVIRVVHNRRIRRLRTNLVAYADDLTRDFRIRNRVLKSKVDDLIRDLYAASDAIPIMQLKELSVENVIAVLRLKTQAAKFKLDFFFFAQQFINDIKNTSTRKTYQVALSALRRYLSSMHLATIDVNDITSDFLFGLVGFINDEPKYYYRKSNQAPEKTSKTKKNGTAAKAYVSKLATIFQAAKDRFNDEGAGEIKIPRSPFAKIIIEDSPSEGQQALSLKTIRYIVKAQTQNQYIRAALDTFIVSFGLMGANLVDLYKASLTGDVWTYRRTKTERRRQDHAQMRVKVPECLAPYLSRLTKHAHPSNWLNLSWRYSSANSATKTINQLLCKWVDEHNAQNPNFKIKHFTLYAARKTWATIARSKACGIDKALVDECLAHVGDFKLTDIYAERDWELMWEANNIVCNTVFND